jgi:CheY-like chemotaxis protein
MENSAIGETNMLLPAPFEIGERIEPLLRVMVVDDDLDTVTIFALLVQESGHDVRTEYEGSAVVEAALDYRPDVVLLDIDLPGLNGFEVATRLREQPALQKVVLIAMTGYGGVSDRRRFQEAGFDHHLVKPCDIGKMLKILSTQSESMARGKPRERFGRTWE